MEAALDPSMDILAMYTLRHLTRMANVYLDDLMERKCLYEEMDTD